LVRLIIRGTFEEEEEEDSKLNSSLNVKEAAAVF
jgi:hypothetical protein